MQSRKPARPILRAAFVIVILFGAVWLWLPSQFAGATTQGTARESSVSVAAPAAQTTPRLPPRPPTPTPAEVPEGDTLILVGGGLGGLGTWLGWQWRKARARKK
jgi:hypothetical protein